jgi:uncharacterized iron-regulated protein
MRNDKMTIPFQRGSRYQRKIETSTDNFAKLTGHYGSAAVEKGEIVGFWKLFSSALLILGTAACAHAGGGRLIDGRNGQTQSLGQALRPVQPGSIVIIGENHGFQVHQQQQFAIMTELRALGNRVSVGMEFFTYTDQPLVDAYRQGTLSEPDFLTAIKWTSPSYDFYRDQATFPDLHVGEKTLALNAPRSLTGKISKTDLSSLTPEEQALMPPDFSLGRDSYKERFLALMGPHLPTPEAGDRYFAAQSTWDDTMAWQAVEFMKQHPNQILVIVVGEFHVQYGGGLPDRIAARLPDTKVWTFSQFNSDGLTDAEVDDAVKVDPKYGPRADFVWISPAGG